MRLLVYEIQGKIFVKARHLKRQSASRVKIRTPWKLQKFQLLLNIQNRERPVTATNIS